MNLSQHYQLIISWLLLTFTLLIFITFEIQNTTHDVQRSSSSSASSASTNRDRDSDQSNQIKTIIAYSLEKQIEIETKVINDCARNANGGEDGDDEQEMLHFLDDTDNDWIRVNNTDLYYYSAFYDPRLEKYPYVRIIGMIQGALQHTFYCHLWPTDIDSKHYTVEAIIRPIWSNEWDQNDTTIYYNPLLISCPIITFYGTPTFVQITKKPCEKLGEKRRKNITIPSARNLMNNFTVCVKNLNYVHDISAELLEWLELHRILGAQNVYLYVEHLTDAVHATIDNYITYISTDTFSVVKRDAPTSRYPNRTGVWQRRRDYLVTYNDCFYRNVMTSRFVALVDLDEVIVPREVDTWPQLYATVLYEYERAYASFMIQNVYYFISSQKNSSSSSSSQALTSHTYRSKYFSPNGESGKSFMATKHSLTVFNHYTLDTLVPGVTRTYFVPHQYAQLNHYRRGGCPYDIECKQYRRKRVRDTIMFKYRNQLLQNIEKVKNVFAQL